MFLKLNIENYTLIRKLEIDFSMGFSVITGETGAGKSIILGALALILGQRADSNVLFEKSQKCIIEGTFKIENYNLENFFLTHDLDYDSLVILRREINAQGKSRAFINDTPVNLSLLKEIGDRLVNIHSQNSIITLNDANFQLAVLDSYAGQLDQVAKFRTLYQDLLRLKNELEFIRERNRKAQEEKDYYRFLSDEFIQAGLKQGEQEELEQRLQVLTHAEEIKTNLFKSSEIISYGETNILSQLSEVIHHVIAVSKFHPEIAELHERLKSNLIDIKDIAAGIEKISDQISIDQEELEFVTSRLDMIYQLQKKHKVTSVDELINIFHSIEYKLLESDHLDEKIKHIQTEIQDLNSQLSTQAVFLSQARKKVIPAIEKEIVRLSVLLGMQHACFTIECSRQADYSRDGFDRVRFLFSANKGNEPDDVSRIASGGELSRLMLCIKSIVSQKKLLPTIIFDEIDNGVSGEVAGKVGSILKKMANNMQVIAITHLPQIAGKGDWHFKVYKTEEQDITISYIKQLSNLERIEEIAKMLSNDKLTPAAIQTAKELLNR